MLLQKFKLIFILIPLISCDGGLDRSDLSESSGYSPFSLQNKPVNKRLTPDDDLKKEIELSSRGDHILLLPGLYSDFLTINIPSGVTISGSKKNEGVVLESKNNITKTPFFDFTGKSDIKIQNITIHRYDRRSVVSLKKSSDEITSSIVLKGLRIYGNLGSDEIKSSKLNRGYTLYLENVENLMIKNCYFYDTYGGLYLKLIRNATIEGNYLERVNFGNIAINNSTDTRVIRNILNEPGKGSKFETAHGDGFSLVGRETQKNLLIDSNKVSNGYCYGLWATASLENAVISNNVFEKGVTTGVAISGDYTSDIFLKGNVFNSNMGSGILFNGQVVKGALVRDNIFFYDKVVKAGKGESDINLKDNTFFKKIGHKSMRGALIKAGNNKELYYVENPIGGFGLEDLNGDPIKLGSTYRLKTNAKEVTFVIKNEGNVPLELQGFPQVILSKEVMPSGLRPDGARGARKSGQSCFLGLCVLSRDQPNRIVLMPNETSSFVVTVQNDENIHDGVILNIPRSVPRGQSGRRIEPFWFYLKH